MTRKLKVLGPALTAALALSFIVASSAQAEGTAVVEVNNGTAGTYHLKGEQISHKRTNGASDSLHVFTAAKREIRCTTAIFTGTVGGKQKEVTITPTYSNCLANITQPTTVFMNGCQYVISGGIQTEGEPHHFDKGTVGITCPENQKIEVHIYSSHANHTAGTPKLCEVTVAPQENQQTITALNTTGEFDAVDLTADVSVDVTAHGSDLVCGADNAVATYEGGTKVKAYDDVAHTEDVDLTVVP